MIAHPDWLVASGLPPGTAGLMTTRAGGVSAPPYASLNLRHPAQPRGADDTGAAVRENRRRVVAAAGAAAPVWLDQVHGTRVVRLHADESALVPPQADASITTDVGVACTVLVADCLPVLLATADGAGVGAAHAGWRGLAGGVLEATVQALAHATGARPDHMVAWLGACIGPQRFEVGGDVVAAFADAPAGLLRPGRDAAHWWADLPGLARWRLARAGVVQVHGGDWCTHSDAARFYSYRRDGVTGRHAALVWRCP